MTDGDELPGWMVFGGLVLFVAALLVAGVQWHDCANQGGAFVQGVWWFECVVRR